MSRGTQENIFLNWATTAFPDANAQNPSKCNAALGNGMFGAEDVVRIAAVTDGTSNTTLFGEMSRFKNEPPDTYNFYNFTAVFPASDFNSSARIQTNIFPKPEHLPFPHQFTERPDWSSLDKGLRRLRDWICDSARLVG